MARYQPPAPNTRPTLIAAAIIGGSILSAAALVNSQLRTTTESLEGIRSGLAETRDQLKAVAAAKPAGNNNQRRRGPDPSKRYTINTKGSPAKGPLTAKVELVEFSDFQ